MLKKLVITGCIEAVLLAAVAMVSPQFIQDHAVWIAISALLILLMIAAYDAIRSAPRTSAEGAQSQTSHGKHSPIFRDVHGNVTITNGSPAEPQPAATSPWDDPKFSLTDPRTHPQAYGQDVLPDMELRELLDRLYNSLGGPAQLVADFEKRVDLEIKDAVKFRRLHTWGRKNPGDGLDDVWSDAWKRGDFSHKRGTIIFRHPDNPTSPVEWSDLRFSKKEVDKWLGPSPQTMIV